VDHSSPRPRSHGGAVENVFASFHLVGYRIVAPGISAIARTIGGTLDLGFVEENWDEGLRLVASICASTVPSQ
jgi:hypothetical protein